MERMELVSDNANRSVLVITHSMILNTEYEWCQSSFLQFMLNIFVKSLYFRKWIQICRNWPVITGILLYSLVVTAINKITIYKKCLLVLGKLVMYIHMYVVSKGDCRVLFSEYKMWTWWMKVFNIVQEMDWFIRINQAVPSMQKSPWW